MSARRPQSSLALRIALLAAGVVVLTALAGGLISINLVQAANEQTGRRALSAIADQAQAAASGPNAAVGQARSRRALERLRIQAAVISPSDTGRPVVVGDPLARRALTAGQVDAVVGGTPLSLRLPFEDGAILVEARPTASGGLILAQRRVDAVALGDQALRQLGWGLVLSALAAIGIGLLVAWRLSLPLKRAAAAAGALAEGRRDVALPETGPREVAEVAAAVNRLGSALAHSEARQREFLLSVSHDLRTPLTAITGYAESIADGVVEPERLRAVGAVMVDEAARLERLVADLLDLARLDAHEMSIRPRRVDLVEVVRSTAASWEHRCAGDGVRFTVEVGAPRLPATVDAQRLRQALDGLLENALRVTPQDAPVVLAARQEGTTAVLEVRDGGPGLSDDDLPVAFDRSVLNERYRGVRQVGTGLGLAIVHRIVERLGGRIEAGHAREGGARFTVRLPMDDPSG